MLSRMLRFVLAFIVAASLGLVLVADIAGQEPPSPSPANENLPMIHVAHSRTYDMPVNADDDWRAMVSEFQIHVKTPTTAWKLQETAGPEVKRFRCKVAADGEYWYLLVTVDKDGIQTPADLQQAPPCQRVLVKTAQPPAAKQPARPSDDPAPRPFPAGEKQPPVAKQPAEPPSPAKEPERKKIDAAVANAFGKDSPEMRRPIRVVLPDIGMVIAAEKASVDADGRMRFTSASIGSAKGAKVMRPLSGDEIVVATEQPITRFSDLGKFRIAIVTVHGKKLTITLTAKDPVPVANEQVSVAQTNSPPPVRPVEISFKFNIDPKTPVAELLPTPLKTPAKLPHWTNEDLAKVPELTFGQPIAKTLPKEKALESMAHRIAKINHLNRSKTDGFMLALIEQRSDLRGLPFLMGEECRTREKQAELFAFAAEGIQFSLAGAREAELPPAEEFWRKISETTGLVQQGKIAKDAKGQIGKETQAQLFHSIVAVTTQVLMPEPIHLRLGMAKFMATVPHPDATKALAKLVLFSPEDEVRAAAIDGLKLRRDKDYTDILLQGFRYPLPAVSKRSAEAIVKLERNDLLENLVQVLEAPDPRLPTTEKREGKEVTFVRELVKVNHHRNCLLCHAPGNTENTPEGVLKVAVPLPGEPLPKPAEGGYQSTPPPSPDITVRIDMTYLRQDFSVLMPVSDAHPWPEMQRFDFLVRTRELSAAEAQAFTAPMEPGRLSPYHRAALYALRELTGRDTEPTAAAWRKLLNLAKAGPSLRTTSYRMPLMEKQALTVADTLPAKPADKALPPLPDLPPAPSVGKQPTQKEVDDLVANALSKADADKRASELKPMSNPPASGKGQGPLSGWLTAKSSAPPPLPVAASSPQSAAAFINRGNSRWDAGQFEQAIADYSDAIRLRPDDADPYKIRGHAFWHQREYDKAIADYSTALRLAPKDTLTLVNRGIAWLRLRNVEQAAADFDTATRLDPNNAYAYMGRALVQYTRGELPAAIAELDSAIRLDPRSGAQRLRGQLWHRQGDLPKAIADFDTALRLKPSDHDVYFARGQVYGEQGNYKKAVADFTSYIRHRPKEGRGYGMRALAYLALGDAAAGWADAAAATMLGDDEDDEKR